MNRLLTIALGIALVLAALYLPSTMTGLLSLNEDYACPGCSVLLITTDTLRADHLSSYGYFRETTPNIDSLASQGLLFEEAYVQLPFTPPSHWSIMTGLYPFHHGMYLPTDSSRLDTLASRMKRYGYSTAAFTSSYMVGQLGSGFDTYDCPDYEGEDRYRSAWNVSERALSWLEGHSQERFFLWVHYFDAHSPYSPPGEFDVYNYSQEPAYSDLRYSRAGVDNFNSIRHDLGKYDGEVSYVDSEVGRVLAALDGLGLSDNTLVVLVSDHGECFGEHDFSDFGYDLSGPCLFHDKTLYQEEVHVPLIIRNPAATYNRNRRIPQIVESIDIPLTILDVLNLPMPSGLDGTSLRPLIEGNGSGFDRAFFQVIPGQAGTFAYGIKTPEWKFVRAGLSLDSHGEPILSRLLFDSINDPQEITNMTGPPDVSAGLEDELLMVLGSESPARLYIDTRTEEILRMFGYLK